MKITILQGIEGAKKAKGLTVIIDVFRAFSTACYLVNQGAEKIIPIEDIEIAYQLKRENPDYILIGERDGYIQPGFDFGNSPSQIQNLNLKDKTVVFTTSSGTQGIANTKNADEIVTGSFVNVGAIVNYIKNKNPENVSLVYTYRDKKIGENEDLACANYIKNSLLGIENNFPEIVRNLKNQDFTEQFINPENKAHPIEDLDLCLTLNKFNFVLKVESYKSGLVYLKKIKV